MPDVLGAPPSPRTALFWNGVAWQWALVDAAGHLQIDVQTILGLDGALQSVATDRLIVRGENQLFSFAGTLQHHITGNPNAANGYLTTGVVPATQIWIITEITSRDDTTATTGVGHARVRAGTIYRFGYVTRAIAISEHVSWTGFIYAIVDDTIRTYFPGCLVGDTCHMWLQGYRMTLEV